MVMILDCLSSDKSSILLWIAKIEKWCNGNTTAFGAVVISSSLIFSANVLMVELEYTLVLEARFL